MNHAISSQHRTNHLATTHTRPQIKHTANHKPNGVGGDQVSLGKGEHAEHDPNAGRLLEGLAQIVEGGHRQAEKLAELGMNAAKRVPEHGLAGGLVKAAESPAGKAAGKVASEFSGGMALFEQFSAMSNPHLSAHEKSKEVWGAALGGLGAVGGGALGTIEGMGVASIPLGVGGAILFGEGGKKLGQDFGGWLVPEAHSSGR